jgi:hypothetical protein
MGDRHAKDVWLRRSENILNFLPDCKFVFMGRSFRMPVQRWVLIYDFS